MDTHTRFEDLNVDRKQLAKLNHFSKPIRFPQTLLHGSNKRSLICGHPHKRKSFCLCEIHV